MKDFICPYCKKELIKDIDFICQNHKYNVRISYRTDNYSNYIVGIGIEGINNSDLVIYPSNYYTGFENCMSLYIYNKHYWQKLPLDPTITPENVDKKIKTYLTFL